MIPDDCYLPPEVSLPQASCTSGAAKRRRRLNDLPRTFLVMDAARNLVLGAFLVVACIYAAEDGEFVSWRCERKVMLKTPYELVPKQRSRAKVPQLSAEVESEIRHRHAKQGGELKDHFITCAGQRWRVWRADDALLHQFTSPECSAPFSFTSDSGFASAVGVQPLAARFQDSDFL